MQALLKFLYQSFSLLLGLSLFLPLLPLRAQTAFEITTPGVNENADEYGGVKLEEIDALQNSRMNNAAKKAALDLINPFRKGRENSSVSGANGRVSGGIDAHTVNSEVLHQNAQAHLENAIELGNLDSDKLTGAEREEKMREARLNSGNCKTSKDAQGNEVIEVRIGGQWIKSDPSKGIYIGERHCKNLSKNLVDRGAAHGTDRIDSRTGDIIQDPHRAYELTKKVRDLAGDPDNENSVGNIYSRQAIRDATWKNFNSEANTALQRVGASRQVVQEGDEYFEVVRMPDGRTNRKRINPDMTSMHSEVSWLKQSMAFRNTSDMTSLTAARLAGIDTSNPQNKQLLAQFKNLASQGTDGNKDAVAQRIAQLSVVGGHTPFCPDGSLKKGQCKGNQLNAPNSPKATDLNKAQSQLTSILSKQGIALAPGQAGALLRELGITANNFKTQPGSTTPPSVDVLQRLQNLEVSRLANYVPSRNAKRLYDQMEKNLDTKRQGQINDQKQKILSGNCLDDNVWCLGNNGNVWDKRGKAGQAILGTNDRSTSKEINDALEKKLFTAISGDPGSYFKDTREIINKSLSRANKGPLSQWMQTMRSADFSENTDRLTESKPYAEMQRRWQENMNQYNQVVQSSRELEQKRKRINPNARVVNVYTKQRGYDADQRSANFLFGARGDRDGRTLELQGNALQNLPNNSRSQPNRPATQPRFRSPARTSPGIAGLPPQAI